MTKPQLEYPRVKSIVKTPTVWIVNSYGKLTAAFEETIANGWIQQGFAVSKFNVDGESLIDKELWAAKNERAHVMAMTIL